MVKKNHAIVFKKKQTKKHLYGIVFFLVPLLVHNIEKYFNGKIYSPQRRLYF